MRFNVVNVRGEVPTAVGVKMIVAITPSPVKDEMPVIW